LISGSFNAALTAALSLAITDAGVFAGANSAYQLSA
jgi:hypothetical protein